MSLRASTAGIHPIAGIHSFSGYGIIVPLGRCPSNSCDDSCFALYDIAITFDETGSLHIGCPNPNGALPFEAVFVVHRLYLKSLQIQPHLRLLIELNRLHV